MAGPLLAHWLVLLFSRTKLIWIGIQVVEKHSGYVVPEIDEGLRSVELGLLQTWMVDFQLLSGTAELATASKNVPAPSKFIKLANDPRKQTLTES